MRKIAFLLLIFSMQATAQYSGPAVETCLKYAQAELKRDGGTTVKLVFDHDRALNIERYSHKLGSQFVSSLLHGNGAIVHPHGVAVEMSFLCLLANDKQAVFFTWTPRKDAPVLAQCRRNPDIAACLDALLLIAEQDLTALYARHFVEARETDAAAKNDNAANAFRSSADAWRAYRDAECARRAGTTAAGGGGDAQKACLVELTKRRGLDLQ